MYKESDTEDNVVTFESGDLLSPNSWSNVDVLESGESHKSIFHKLSTMVKNIRYLYNLINNLSTKYDREHPTGYASLDASGHVFICNEPNKVFDPSQSTGNTAVAASTWYVTEKYNSLGKSVADGKKAVADAISAQGYTTATDATFATLTEQVGVMGNGRYNSGYNAGHSAGYSAGVTDADNRLAYGSVSYAQGKTDELIAIQNSIVNGAGSASGWVALWTIDKNTERDASNWHGVINSGMHRCLFADVRGDRYIELEIGYGDINSSISNASRHLATLAVF